MQSLVSKIDKTSGGKYQKQIDLFQENLSHQSIWQNISWTQMLLETRYITSGYFVGIFEDDSEKNLVLYGILEKRSIGFGQFGLFLIGGPLKNDSQHSKKADTEILFFSECEKLCREENCLFVQIEPLESLFHPKKNWKIGSFKKFIEPWTAQIDLSLTEDEILANMKPKGRYNIKVAEKNEVTIEWKTCTKKNMTDFYGLLTETTKRDGFATNSLSYFETLGKYIEDASLGSLLFASREDEFLAAGLFIYHGKTALYYYGASVSEPEKRKYMASYLLQWEAIKEGKNRGCLTYDFLGIAPPDDPNHHLAGVTDFKLKLSQKTHHWPNALFFAPISWKYTLFLWLKKLNNLRK